MARLSELALAVMFCVTAGCGGALSGETEDAGTDTFVGDSSTSPPDTFREVETGAPDAVDALDAVSDAFADAPPFDSLTDGDAHVDLPCGDAQAFTEACHPTVEVGNGGAFFGPGTVSVRIGGSVRWHFVVSGHNVVSGTSCVADGEFCSPSDASCTTAATMAKDSTYEHTFTTPGTYEYFSAPFCSSAAMRGLVKVVSF